MAAVVSIVYRFKNLFTFCIFSFFGRGSVGTNSFVSLQAQWQWHNIIRCRIHQRRGVPLPPPPPPHPLPDPRLCLRLRPLGVELARHSPVMAAEHRDFPLVGKKTYKVWKIGWYDVIVSLVGPGIITVVTTAVIYVVAATWQEGDGQAAVLRPAPATAPLTTRNGVCLPPYVLRYATLPSVLLHRWREATRWEPTGSRLVNSATGKLSPYKSRLFTFPIRVSSTFHFLVLSCCVVFLLPCLFLLQTWKEQKGSMKGTVKE